MQASELADRAEAFPAGINGFDGRLQRGRSASRVTPDDTATSSARSARQREALTGSIDRTASCSTSARRRANLWTRITHHPDVAQWQGDSAAK